VGYYEVILDFDFLVRGLGYWFSENYGELELVRLRPSGMELDTLEPDPDNAGGGIGLMSV
jgi:hypothetical protein